MPYSINSYQGVNSAFSVNDKTIDNTSISIKIVGRKVENYGEIIAENFYHMLENFAGPVQPANPVKGQIWAETDATPGSPVNLRVYNGNSWDSFKSSIEVGNTLPNPIDRSDGSLFFDTNEGKFYVKSGANWKLLSGIFKLSSAPNFNESIEGSLWFDQQNQELKVRVNNSWLTVVTNSPSLTGIGTNWGLYKNQSTFMELAIVEVSGKIVAAFSDDDVNAGLLAGDIYTLRNGTTVNLGTSAFTNGLSKGFNFASNFKTIAFTSGAIVDIKSGNLVFKVSNTERAKIDSNNTEILNKFVVSGNPAEFNTTSYIKLPVGTNTQRPSLASNEIGHMRWNTDANNLEIFVSGTWKSPIILDQGNGFTAFIKEIEISSLPSVTPAAGAFVSANIPPGGTYFRTVLENKNTQERFFIKDSYNYVNFYSFGRPLPPFKSGGGTFSSTEQVRESTFNVKVVNNVYNLYFVSYIKGYTVTGWYNNEGDLQSVSRSEFHNIMNPSKIYIADGANNKEATERNISDFKVIIQYFG